jgi:hypothetical protein
MTPLRPMIQAVFSEARSPRPSIAVQFYDRWVLSNIDFSHRYIVPSRHCMFFFITRVGDGCVRVFIHVLNSETIVRSIVDSDGMMNKYLIYASEELMNFPESIDMSMTQPASVRRLDQSSCLLSILRHNTFLLEKPPSSIFI